ncbi:uncharacterized protein AMSG_10572 [Thecamonas trahens ATCC 50062]|uniref:Protein kinase domain-containing protein n=1 Tax=Thecamonas trahens ATCC 50062 TaxID=461836 RepID=A0A0L0DTW0_THETB|nr:hypothetical protein AMSG_10572 [Thecamonas trahens ATCC 50062]KNC54913.1 hypothetical protein AMSG_10572 [Thecamonas trahens ATCC 50062]|eukprot:XP_013753503.1 hypothetical protein AMSG_10572 [Thecamonas trahens ATCC 50062]
MGAQAFLDAYHAASNASRGDARVSLHRFDFSPDRSVYELWLTPDGAPDIVPLYNGADLGGFIDDGLFLDISDIWEEADLNSDMLESARRFASGPDGTRYGVPSMGTTSLCVYHRPTFYALGLSPPTTWSAFLDMCDTISISGRGCLGIDLPYLPPGVILDYLFIRMHGNEFYDAFLAANISFTDPRILSSLSAFGELIHRSAFVVDLSSVPLRLWDASGLSSGRIAVYCGFESVASVAVANGLAEDDLDAFAFPAIYDGPGATVSPGPATDGGLGTYMAFGIPTRSLFPDTAKNVLRYMAKRSVQEALISTHAGTIPAHYSLRNAIAANRTRIAFEVMAASSNAYGRSAMTGFGYGELVTEWQDFMFALHVISSQAQADALVSARIPVLEAIRQAEVLRRATIPTITPSTGSYTGPITVSLTRLNTGATIYYTIDGSVPSEASLVYTGPIALLRPGQHVVQAFAIRDDLRRSDTATATYDIVTPVEVADSNAALLLAIVLPLVVVCCIGLISIGFVIYRRKAVTYKLQSDSDLVINPRELLVGQVVGEGSYGTVYAGRWRATPVAVKRTRTADMNARQLREFIDESSMLMRLRHPNVVIFMGVTLEPPAIVTEFMSRGSMYAVLHAPDLFLDPSIVLKWAHAITMGLQYLSHAGVIHGDFKSLNVLFDSSWVPKLCDFGMSSVKKDARRAAALAGTIKPDATDDDDITSDTPDSAPRVRFNNRVSAAEFDDAGSPAALDSWAFALHSSHYTFGLRTKDGLLGQNIGTLFWTAPEVLVQGAAALSSASDAYSLALTLWELATRGDLYPGENPLAVALEVVHGRRPDLDDVPLALAQLKPIIEALWLPNPNERPTLDEASAVLGTLYSPQAVVYPNTSAAPSGTVGIIRIMARAALAALVSDTYNAAARIRAFHNHAPTLARRGGGSIIDWGLGWISVACYKPAQVVDVVTHFSRIENETHSLSMAATFGPIVSSTDGLGHVSLSGPVITDLARLWVFLFGAAGSGFEPLLSVTFPLCASWEHHLPGGVFFHSDLASELLGMSSVALFQLELPTTHVAPDTDLVVYQYQRLGDVVVTRNSLPAEPADRMSPRAMSRRARAAAKTQASAVASKSALVDGSSSTPRLDVANPVAADGHGTNAAPSPMQSAPSAASRLTSTASATSTPPPPRVAELPSSCDTWRPSAPDKNKDVEDGHEQQEEDDGTAPNASAKSRSKSKSHRKLRRKSRRSRTSRSSRRRKRHRNGRRKSKRSEQAHASSTLSLSSSSSTSLSLSSSSTTSSTSTSPTATSSRSDALVLQAITSSSSSSPSGVVVDHVALPPPREVRRQASAEEYPVMLAAAKPTQDGNSEAQTEPVSSRTPTGTTAVRTKAKAKAPDAERKPAGRDKKAGASARAPAEIAPLEEDIIPEMGLSMSLCGESRVLAEWLVPGAVLRRHVETSCHTWLGSYANVHRATLDGVPVVIKVLLRQEFRPAELLRVAILAARAARAASSRLVGPKQACFCRPNIALVFRYYPGLSLRNAVNIDTGSRMLTAAETRLAMVGLAKSLHELHTRFGAGHGSLRPSNILLVRPQGRVIDAHLVDYGLQGIRASMGTMTLVPAIAYMSPEDLAGVPGTRKGDIFVLGSILYEVITARPAFSGTNALEVGYHIASGHRPPIDAAVIPSPLLRDIINSCWHADELSRPTINVIASQLSSTTPSDFKRSNSGGLAAFASGVVAGSAGGDEAEYGLVGGAGGSEADKELRRKLKMRKVADEAGLTSQFTTESTEVVDSLMHKHVEEEMRKRKEAERGGASTAGAGGQGGEGNDGEGPADDDDIYAVPETLRIQEKDNVLTAIVKGAKRRKGFGLVGADTADKDELASKLSLTNIVEVDLPAEHLLRNVQATADARKDMLAKVKAERWAWRKRRGGVEVADTPGAANRAAGYRRYRSYTEFGDKPRKGADRGQVGGRAPRPRPNDPRQEAWDKFRAGGASDEAFAANYRKYNMRR